MSCFHNNSNNMLVRVLPTSCCNNLIYYICVLLMHRLIAWFFSAPFLRDTGYFHLLHHVGLQNCSGTILLVEEGGLCTCHLTPCPSSVTHHFYLHSSGGRSVCALPSAREAGKSGLWLVSYIPAATPHCGRGAESFIHTTCIISQVMC